MKKGIDIHIHIDGSITADIARRIAPFSDVKLPENDDELKKMLTVPHDCADLGEFLKCFALPVSLMQTYEGIREATGLVLDDQSRQGIIYTELRFAPQLHLEKGLTQRQVIEAALLGMKEAGERSSIKSNLILCMMRLPGNEEANRQTLELAREFLVRDGGVVAIDLAGAEALFPLEGYRDLFDLAREYGIPFTIHAGEASGAESVKQAVEYGAARIGHGVRSYEDPLLLERLIREGIVLEMCPTSNRQTCAVRDMNTYPFMDYLQRGLKVTLNTDDPAIENTCYQKELRYMEDNFGLSIEQEKLLLENAIDGAFTTPEYKKELKSILL